MADILPDIHLQKQELLRAILGRIPQPPKSTHQPGQPRLLYARRPLGADRLPSELPDLEKWYQQVREKTRAFFQRTGIPLFVHGNKSGAYGLVDLLMSDGFHLNTRDIQFGSLDCIAQNIQTGGSFKSHWGDFIIDARCLQDAVTHTTHAHAHTVTIPLDMFWILLPKEHLDIMRQVAEKHEVPFFDRMISHEQLCTMLDSDSSKLHWKIPERSDTVASSIASACKTLHASVLTFLSRSRSSSRK